MADKQYNFEYWLAELIDLGKSVEPDKYTGSYIAHMRKAWSEYPLTLLHNKVLKRRSEILELNK